ncbi:hypothetical protein AP1H75_10120 [Apilactobacillus apinorum]|uniref:hypothetical protein n=1 Tax=Apilactobacillus apinorum TaxID=1218495 RepID=UPI0030E8DA5E
MKFKKSLFAAFAATALFTTVFSTVANNTNNVTASAKAKAKAKHRYAVFTPTFYVVSADGHPTQFFKRNKPTKILIKSKNPVYNVYVGLAPDNFPVAYHVFNLYYGEYKGKFVNFTKYEFAYRVDGAIDTKKFESIFGAKRISMKEYKKLNVHHPVKKYNKKVEALMKEADDENNSSQSNSSSQADSSSQASSTSSSN